MQPWMPRGLTTFNQNLSWLSEPKLLPRHIYTRKKTIHDIVVKLSGVPQSDDLIKVDARQLLVVEGSDPYCHQGCQVHGHPGRFYEGAGKDHGRREGHDAWLAQDQQVINYIVNSLTKDVLVSVVKSHLQWRHEQRWSPCTRRSHVPGPPISDCRSPR